MDQTLEAKPKSSARRTGGFPPLKCVSPHRTMTTNYAYMAAPRRMRVTTRLIRTRFVQGWRAGNVCESNTDNEKASLVVAEHTA